MFKDFIWRGFSLKKPIIRLKNEVLQRNLRLIFWKKIEIDIE